MPGIRLAELADIVQARVLGDASLSITEALPLQDLTVLDEPLSAGDCITLLDSNKQLSRLQACEAGAVVVAQPIELAIPQLIVDDIHNAFATIVKRLRPEISEQTHAIHPQAQVDPTAILGNECSVGPGVRIGQGVELGTRCVIHSGCQIMPGCKLGDDCVLFPNVVLYPQTRIGCRAILHAGVVLGADGFGYRQQAGEHMKSPQLGWVKVEDDVEIGANSTIDRGTYGATLIGAGTKIDNLVQIGHNCQIGRANLICAQVGIAGSSTTGDGVVIAGQVGIADHIHIAERTVLAAQAGVLADTQPGQVLLGSPAGPRKSKLREWVLTTRLPEMSKELKTLQRAVAALEATVSHDEQVEGRSAKREDKAA